MTETATTSTRQARDAEGTTGPRTPSVEPRASSSAARPSTLDPRISHVARRALVGAALLGVAGDALLRDGPWGVGLPLWILLGAATIVAVAWSLDRRLTREQGWWLAAIVVLALPAVVRDADALIAWDVLAGLCALAMLSMTLVGAPAAGVFQARVRDLVWALVSCAASAMVAVVPLALRDAVGPARRERDTAASRATITRGALVRAALVTIPILLVFGALLVSADPVFASLVSLPALDWGLLVSHVVVAGFFAWITGGWLRGALVDGGRTWRRAVPPDGTPVSLGVVEITAALGALTALFALFVVVQLGWMFGGEALVRARTGLTYAQYARRGFFELVWVALLVLPLLLGAHAAIPADDVAAARRLRRLALPLLGLLGVMMISALARMKLYVHYYGLTTDRLYATLFMCWLGVVLAWLALTVLRGWARPFAGGAAVSGLLSLLVLNAADPVGIVAWTNLRVAPALTETTAAAASVGDAAYRQRPADVAYLASLGADAAPRVVRALLAPPAAAPGTPRRLDEVKGRCAATTSLLRQWGARAEEDAARTGEGDWRRWNLARSRARAAVRASEPQLRRTVTCWDEDTKAEVPFGVRDYAPKKRR